MRRWYSLEQAVKIINKKRHEEFTIDDLMHLWINRKLEVYIRCEIRKNINIASYIITPKDFSYLYLQDDKLEGDSLQSDYLDFFIYDIDFYAIDKDPGLIEKTGLEHILKNLFINRKISKKIVLNGFLSIIYSFKEKELEKTYINNGICSDSFVFATPKISGKNRIMMELSLKKEIILSVNDLFILDYDINQFIMSDYFSTSEYTKLGMPKDSLNSLEEITLKNEQKTIEKTVERMENLEAKDPIQYGKEFTKKLVINSCIETAKDYPTAGKNTLVKAVIQKLRSDPTIGGLIFQSERTYTNALDKMGIDFPDEKGKTIEISKVTIVKP